MFLFRDSLPNLNCHIRFFHAAPGAPEIDVYIDGTRVAKNLGFSTMTDYSDFSTGDHDLQIFTKDSTENALYTEKITLLPNSTQTLSAILLESTLSIFNLKDATSLGESDLSFVRFINFSPDSPLLTLGLPNGDVLFNGVEYIESTGYYPISAGIYDFVISATGASAFRKFLKDIYLETGKFHTIYIIGFLVGNPQMGSLIVSDGFEQNTTKAPSNLQ